MNKIAMITLAISICIMCVGCGKNKVENSSLNENNQDINIKEDVNVQESGEDEQEYVYVEGITDPVIIEENENELKVNVTGNMSSIYKCSGDTVIEWCEKYYFETEELAQNFADEQEDKEQIIVNGKTVIRNIEIPEGTVMRKSDLLSAYSSLKDVYENEQ